ncbi:hypothetical protein C2845_PM09G13260 [Panicum miliaceum]|uniref:Uncharacterized protein n=1 Tax=Panicum miliaceum TaxID=4540 RepID=A0A3L6RZ67_PANMI|nr:hypothetical protein C2845_PM09G13260 [Panicum miliaceum]
MAGEVPAEAAAAAVTPPTPELVWSPSTMTDADIEALVAQGLLPEKAISGGEAAPGRGSPRRTGRRWSSSGRSTRRGSPCPHGRSSEAKHLKPNSITQVATFIH